MQHASIDSRATVNRQITLASRPSDLPAIADFHLVYAPLAVPADGEVLVRLSYFSLDPGLLSRMSGAPVGDTVAIGDVLAGAAVGHVISSRASGFHAGDAVLGMLGWQEYAVAAGSALRKLDAGAAPISTALGVLGIPGLTAYFGLLEIGAPQSGETVVVSAAAGAVGAVAGQIARIKGCRVVGTATGAASVDWLIDEIGFDGAFDPAVEDVDAILAQLCPDLVDVYFDSVGGSLSDAVARRLAVGARISLSGALAQEGGAPSASRQGWRARLVARQARAEGFQVSRYVDGFAAALGQLALWLAQGKLEYREDVADGIAAAPQAFIGMLQGGNEETQLVRLSFA